MNEIESGQREIEINVPILARVEGEGALDLFIRDGQVEKLQLKIFEPPRFFEKFLEGRSYQEVPDMVARICGICPVAYQMSAVHAIEAAFDVEITPWIRAMRRLIYCGEWLESHSLHIHLLAAPDYLGYQSVAEMAKDHPQIVQRGLQLQKIGNDIIHLLGGRSVHPVGVKVGGFYRAPLMSEARDLQQRIEALIPQAEALLRWLITLNLPIKNNQGFTCVAMRHASDYPMNEGCIVSTTGLNIDASAFEHYFSEHQVPYSTALHCLLQEQTYLVGPLARLNLNATCLPEQLKMLMAELGIQLPIFNSFSSIIARAIEIYYALYEANQILKHYQIPQQASVDVKAKPGLGYACTEAPRGTLWHRYELDARGAVVSARIVPPTSQNQAQIEQDLRQSLTPEILQLNDDEIRLHCEKIIRNYDPCISCATHFIDLRVNRI